uniref:Protein Wnt n=1 Tax=Phallusia mammillata TaxID=59560 RepID=A0A6F9DX97_9ASCI|nr:Wnt-3 [Phallusia mammillata]
MNLVGSVAVWIYPMFWFVIFRMVTSKCEARNGAPKWWNVASTSVDMATMACSRIPGLNSRQLRFCTMNRSFMPSIADGTQLGFKQCQLQFKNRRWNCSTSSRSVSGHGSRRRNLFGSVLERGSKEAAFVHALAAAGVAHSITKSCWKGNLENCKCNNIGRLRPRFRSLPRIDWKWGSCDENVEYGIARSRDFVDARDQSPYARSIMNLHNNEAGREALRDQVRRKCKCHGVSGSCELKTCWLVLPDFNQVGAYLKQRYLDASLMKVQSFTGVRGCEDDFVPSHSFHRRPTKKDLIYYESSPDFCDRNVASGIKGTRGRICNADSEGVDGCFLLCCGRGHTTKRKTRVEKCRCVFQWCCKVKCEDCVIEYEEHTCK